jgi:(E)-4-hydroxy-3-methylbut-2-enyl-diphosphate synthase
MEKGYSKRITTEVTIGGIPMGGHHPVRIQSMANTPTANVSASVEQCIRLSRAGADYVRFTVPSVNDVRAFGMIRDRLREGGFTIPLIADVHFNAEIAMHVCEVADKVRINPGNFANGDTYRLKFRTFLEKCRQFNVAVRIGVNHGSLSARMMEKYGDTPEGMVESAMEYLDLCKEAAFDQVVVSMKSSNVRVMVQANRMLANRMDEKGMPFPLHLGVTEAGEGEDGRIKSATGIGTLLQEGLGDTIRVSLTEEPEMEIPVARKLVQHVMDCRRDRNIPYYMPAESYSRRNTKANGTIGGKNVPVIIGNHELCDMHPGQITFPSFTLDAVINGEVPANLPVILFRSSAKHAPAELQALRRYLDEKAWSVPVIIHREYRENDLESFQIKSAADLGGAFIDGFGDGLWLANEGRGITGEQVTSTAFSILQACRVRMSRTEYISCPSCGRTNFNLIETLARIKSATGHLKGLKIGVMGCIVNGPGEMADADYGYVGTGAGKVTLYKSKEVIKRGIPEESAVDELIALIKENGDWRDPLPK